MRNAGICLVDFLHSSARLLSKNIGKFLNKSSQIVENGGPGWFWGGLRETWEAFWSQDGPKLKQCRKSYFGDSPAGTKLVAEIEEQIIHRRFFTYVLRLFFKVWSFHRFEVILGSDIDVFLKWSTGLKCGKYCLELSFAVFLTSSVFVTSRVLPGLLFEVILVPSWHQVG